MKLIRCLQGVALFTSSVLALGAQTTSDPGGLAGPVSSGPRPTLTSTIDLTGGTLISRTAAAPVGFAPARFSNVILTQTPANATGSGGVSTVFSSTGSQFTFGAGGSLTNPAEFDYEITGPNTATVTVPAGETNAAATTSLVFTGENTGTYTTVAGDSTTTGAFGLSTIPSSAPLANLSARTTVTGNSQAIVGFVIAGSAPRQVLIRAVGPSLANFDVTQPLQNPTLRLFHDRQLIATNESWGALMPLPPIALAAESTGTTTSGTSSGTTRSTSGTASGVSTTEPGTTTEEMGGAGSLEFTGTLAGGETFTTRLATSDQFTAVGAFGLDEGSEDAAFVATLPPGAYTVVVGRSNPAGVVGDVVDAMPGGASGATERPQPESGTGTGNDAGSGVDSAAGTDTGSGAGSGEVLVEVYFIE